MSKQEAEVAFSAGNAAFVDEEYTLAIEHYSTAISHDDIESEYYIKRSQAYLKLGKHTESIMDTKSALEYAPESPRAHFRQGQSFYAAKMIEDAKQALSRAKKYGETHGDCEKLLSICHTVLGTTPDIDAGAPATAVETVISSDYVPPPLKTTEPRIMHDWYQVEAWATVDVFIKKADPANVQVTFSAKNLNVAVKLPTGSAYNLELDLCFQIIPEKSKFSVKGTKIEIRMAKKVHVKWPALEGEGLEGDERSAVSMAAASAMDAVAIKPPGYDNDLKWEKLGAQIDEDEKNEKPEGDGALNKLFKDIYKNATPEQMKAMNKSYQESGGTVLSTNWNEIGKEETPVKPPDGMEFKKWS